MNNLKQAILRLAEAGKAAPDIQCVAKYMGCYCFACRHNTTVEQAAAEALAELEKQSAKLEEALGSLEKLIDSSRMAMVECHATRVLLEHHEEVLNRLKKETP